MGVVLHWFLPANGDSRQDLSLGSAARLADGRGTERGSAERAPDISYIEQVARSAEHLGFADALTPTSSWCEDVWVVTAALSQVTERCKFFLAFRPGLMSPTLAAQVAATYQRVSRGRLLLSVVAGGGVDAEQQRPADHLDEAARYRSAGEFLHVVRALWQGRPVSYQGEFINVRDAQIIPATIWPDIYLGGSSEAAINIAAEHADVYLASAEPPARVAEKLDRVRERAKATGRELRFGIRLHVVSRDTDAEAWAQAKQLPNGLDPATIPQVPKITPDPWAGCRRGSEQGNALVGSHDRVADRIAEYHELGIDELLLSGDPHLEEACQFGEGVIPRLRKAGLLATDAPAASLMATGQ